MEKMQKIMVFIDFKKGYDTSTKKKLKNAFPRNMLTLYRIHMIG